MLDFKLTKKQVPITLFFCIIILTSFWNIQLLFPLILVVIFKVYKTSQYSFRLSYLDIGFIILLTGEIITTIFSSYRYNSLGSVNRIVIIFSMYIFYKNIFKKGDNHFLGSLIFYFFSSILLIVTVKYFMFFYKNLTSEGFFELNNFKNLYTPFGVLNNIWASILLLFIPFNLIFLIHQNKKVDKILLILNLLFTVFSIIVSFSRGTYLSVFVFVLLLNVLLINYLRFKQLFLYNIIVILMFSSSALLMYNSFKTTISFNKIESQQRSTDGRVALWEHSLRLIKDRPIVGYGQDNYLLAQDKYPYLGEDIANSYRTNNTYIELLIERGILGFSSYLFFFLIILIIVFKNLKSRKNNQKEKIEIAIIFSGIIALLVREFTFSSLFENDFVYLLTFHLVFLLIPYDIKIKEYKFSQRKKTRFLAISLVMFSILFIINTKRVLLVYNNYKFVEAYEKDEIDKSLKSIDKALLLSPKNIILNKHKAIALATSAYKINISEEYSNLLYVSDLNKDSLNLSLKYLQKVLVKKPFDSETNNNLGWVNFILGNNEKAGYYFNKSIELNPFISQYHIGILLYDIKNENEKYLVKHLSDALRLSPEILASKFFLEFYKKYPIVASEAKEIAIKELADEIATKSSPVLKARLARLLLDENPVKSFQLLKEVINLLPNMNRPWLYTGYLVENTKDSIEAEKYFKKSIFLRKKDFLPKLYYGKYLEEKGMDDKAVSYFKEALESYKSMKSPLYGQNRALSGLKTIPNSYMPNNLLYFLKPYVNAFQIFYFFGNYYGKQNNEELKEYYKKLALKYENNIFKGEDKLR